MSLFVIHKLQNLARVQPKLRAYLLWELLQGFSQVRLRGRSANCDSKVAAGAAAQWLQKAYRATHEQGFAAVYSLTTGYAAGYPETTGYIATTLFKLAAQLNDKALHELARQASDWLISVQYADGSIQAGYVGMQLPGTVFNTGMVLSGWVSAYQATREAKYLQAAQRAAAWLCAAQDGDGCWRRHLSTFAMPRPFNTYNVLVAWELARLATVDENSKWKAAAANNIDWSLTQKNERHFFAGCQMAGFAHPITHTIGYTLQGLLEGGLITGQGNAVDSALAALRELRRRQAKHGGYAGIYDDTWSPRASWECLTGTAQITLLMWRAWQISGEPEFRLAYALGQRWLLRNQLWAPNHPELHGALGGSFPIYGGYMPYNLPNWAAKYLIDVLLADWSAQEVA